MFLFMYVCWICRKYFVQLTAALQHMHSRRVMHRGILMWFHCFHLSFMINLERNWSMWNMKYVLSPTNHTLWLSRSHMHSPLTSPWNLAIYMYTYPVYPWNEYSFKLKKRADVCMNQDKKKKKKKLCMYLRKSWWSLKQCSLWNFMF